jgi:hypothetical protein
VKRADEDERRYSALIRQVTYLLNGTGLSSNAPSEMSAEDWTNLKRIDQEIVFTGDRNSRKQAELEQQERETMALKWQVLRQLEVINIFINDPGVIDRIEEYEAVFAPGNLVNLKRLAQLLRNAPNV